MSEALVVRRGPRLSVLMLCDDRPDHANTVLDHISALRRLSRHRVRSFNPVGRTGPLPIRLEEFDAVVIHYTLVCSSEYYLNQRIREQLSRYRGLKVQFIQDEYRWISEITSAMAQMGVHVVFTCIPEPDAEKVYGPRVPGLVRVPTLTGYVPDNLMGLTVPPTTERPVEIGYRAREIPYWLGTLAQEKQLIASGVLERAPAYHLKCDISFKESERIYGRRWIEFLSSCRATLGTGSGASIADFDGEVQRSVEQYLQFNREASFQEVSRAVLEPYEGSLALDVVSPRIFEAIALRTALVLFPSPYSGVVKPWEHYIPLAKDFSNMAEVVSALRDDSLVTEMTERAYADVVATGRYSYREFARGFDAVIEERATHRLRLQPTYNLVALQQQLGKMQIPARVAAAARPISSHAHGPAFLERLLRDPRGYSLKGYLATRAIFRSRHSRSIVLRKFSPSDRAGPSLDVVLEDLMKLEILSQAHQTRLTAGVIFKARPHLTGAGVLVMRSLEIERSDPDASRGEEVLDAILDGGVTTLVWDHTAIAPCVWHALTRKRWLMFWVGTAGIHEFPLVRHLLASDRAAALTLLRQIMDLPATPAPVAEAPHDNARAGRRLNLTIPRPRGWAPGARLLRHPLWYSTRSYLALRTIARHPEYRGLLMRYAVDRGMRRTVRVDAMLEDLLKMDLLKRACANPNGFHVQLQGNAGQWVYVSSPGAKNGSRPPAVGDAQRNPVKRVAWDHSAVGRSLTMPMRLGRTLPVYLGTEGLYEFTALTTLSASYPEMIARMLPTPD